MAETLNQRWAAQLVGALVGAGVGHAVIAPGSRSSPLVLALADRRDVQCWPVVDERVAGFFALGLAKATEAPVALVVTSGTAGAHLLPAVIEAAEGGTPLVVLTADRPWELHGFGAPQTIDQEGLFGRFVRAEAALPAPLDSLEALAHLAQLVAKTVATGLRAPIGPVHFNVPFGEPLAPESSGPGPVVDPPQARWTEPARTPVLDEVLPLVERAARGLIVCGPRERQDGFGEAVHRLGAHLGFPVLAEATSNARYGFTQGVAMYDALWRSERFAAQMKPDLIVSFGGGATAKSMIQLSAPTVVRVSEDGRLVDPHHRAQYVVVGDAVATCQGLLAARPGSTTWRTRWLEAEGRLVDHLFGREGLDEPLLARDLVRSLPAGTNLVLSSSMPVRAIDAFAPVSRGPLAVYSNRGVNGIDGVTSTALGIAAATGKPTVLFIGDLALLHDAGAWVLARSLKVDLTVVVVNNDGGGIFHFLPIAARTRHFERYFGAPHGVELAPLAALAQATMHRPATLEAFQGALSSALGGGLHLIEVKTSRKENVERHRALFASLGEAAR
jgi:2-succinyl-5-enolpyruvyl-6-hydroxy-3-cyclohexene-1-carboxylate synthase